MSFKVTNLTPYVVTPIPALEQCQFSRQISSNSGGYLYIFYTSDSVHNTVVNNYVLPNSHQSSITIECLK
jgi:hypothetical protein